MNVRKVGLGAVAGSVVVIGGQIVYAGFRRLPEGEDHDPSGRIGDPTLPELHIALLGDSVMTGHGLEDVDLSWPRLVARQLSDRFHVILENYAVGGARTDDLLEEQVARAEERTFDIVFVSAGANDMLRMKPVWGIERRLDEAVVRLQKISKSVILFGVGDVGSAPRFPFPADRLAWGSGHVADWVHRRVADRRGIAKIDQWELTTDAFNSGPHMWSEDLFHPSPEGHQAWADAAMLTLEEELVRIGAHPVVKARE